MTISTNMKVSEQCGIAASEGNQILWLIRRNITYKKKELIIPVKSSSEASCRLLYISVETTL